MASSHFPHIYFRTHILTSNVARLFRVANDRLFSSYMSRVSSLVPGFCFFLLNSVIVGISIIRLLTKFFFGHQPSDFHPLFKIHFCSRMALARNTQHPFRHLFVAFISWKHSYRFSYQFIDGPDIGTRKYSILSNSFRTSTFS